jgi:hypothetical protein
LLLGVRVIKALILRQISVVKLFFESHHLCCLNPLTSEVFKDINAPAR